MLQLFLILAQCVKRCSPDQTAGFQNDCGKGREETGGLKEYLFVFVLDPHKLESPRVKLGSDFGLKSHYFLLSPVKGRPPGDGASSSCLGGSMGLALAVEAFAFGLMLTLLLWTSQG